MHYWGAFKAIPQWTIALIALVIVLTVNMISVKLFGEMEFWAALIKVVALVRCATRTTGICWRWW
jgi:L-asparagine permease